MSNFHLIEELEKIDLIDWRDNNVQWDNDWKHSRTIEKYESTDPGSKKNNSRDTVIYKK